MITTIKGRNTNLGSRFMARASIKKPKEEQNPDPRYHSLYYTLNDLYVGAIVNFNSHHFLITAADEYVFSYMERESEKEKVVRLDSNVFEIFS